MQDESVENSTANDTSVRSGTTIVLASEVVQLIGMLVVLFGLAYSLSDRDFGLFSGGLAVATILGTAARLGSHTMVIRAPSVGTGVPLQWRRSNGVMLATNSLAVIVMLALRPIVTDRLSVGEALALVLMQTFGFMWSELAVAVGIAVKRESLGLVTRAIYALGRVGGLAVFLTVDSSSRPLAIYCLTLGALVGSLLCHLWLAKALASSVRAARPAEDDIRRGAGFMMNDLGYGLLVSLDRPVLTGYGYEVAAGTYSLGYRVAQVASLPALAYVRVTNLDFFTAGAEGSTAMWRTLRRLVTVGLVLGGGMGLVVFFSADLLSVVLGDRFTPVELAVRWLAPLPFLMVLQSLPANALTGMDRQGLRNGLLLGAAAINLGLNVLWVPEHSWRGAAAATLIAESLHGLVLWAVVWAATRKGHSKSKGHNTRND